MKPDIKRVREKVAQVIGGHPFEDPDPGFWGFQYMQGKPVGLAFIPPGQGHRKRSQEKSSFRPKNAYQEQADIRHSRLKSKGFIQKRPFQ